MLLVGDLAAAVGQLGAQVLAGLLLINPRGAELPSLTELEDRPRQAGEGLAIGIDPLGSLLVGVVHQGHQLRAQARLIGGAIRMQRGRPVEPGVHATGQDRRPS